MHGYMKDGAKEGVADAGRRRIRGVAAQSVLVAFQLLATNMRKIDGFLRKRSAALVKKRTRPRRRSSQPIQAFAPVAADPPIESPPTSDDLSPPSAS